MKSDGSTITSALGQEDSSKLVSLLALAAGALAMPQSSNADVIVTDLSTNFVTVGPNGSPSFLIDNLPGTARLGFDAHERSTLIGSSRVVSAGQKGGYVRVKSNAASFLLPAAAGATWNQIAGVSTVNGLAGKANGYGHFPNSFVHLYLPFKFTDITQVGSPVYYGWVDVSLNNPDNGTGPDLTIFSYAYDNTGATIPMGAVPEPAPTSLFALGALTLGASGVRAWRKNRKTEEKA
jgi:hypothetical protein